MVGGQVVYKAVDEDCLLRGQLHPMVRDRLGRVRELAHVGVANLLGVERRGGGAVLVWERVEGRPLEEFLAGEEVDGGRLRGMGRELIGHVETMHALGIVHGAIHERNVIVTPEGGLKLTHVSPLLYTEAQVDVEAVASLLEEMGLVEAGPVTDLRELRRRLEEGPEAEDSGEVATMDRTPVTARRLALTGAVLAAVAGAVLAWAFWRVAADSNDTPEAAVAWPEGRRP